MFSGQGSPTTHVMINEVSRSRRGALNGSGIAVRTRNASLGCYLLDARRCPSRRRDCGMVRSDCSIAVLFFMPRGRALRVAASGLTNEAFCLNSEISHIAQGFRYVSWRVEKESDRVTSVFSFSDVNNRQNDRGLTATCARPGAQWRPTAGQVSGK